MRAEFSKIDGMGLYVRFGADPIKSFADYYDIGTRVYYNEPSGRTVGVMTGQKQAVAFDVEPGCPIQVAFLAAQMCVVPADLAAALDGLEVTRGWARA